MDVNGLGDFKSIVLVMLMVLQSACGGGSGGGGDTNEVQVSALLPIEILPNHLSADVAIDPLVSVTFSGDIHAPSVNVDSFQLLKANAPIAGQISFVASNEIQFSVDNDLNLLARYSGKTTTDITDIEGLPLAKNIEWNFLTRDGNWQEQKALSSGAINNPVVIGSEDSMWMLYQRDNIFSGKVDLYTRYRQSDGTFSLTQLVSNNATDGNVFGEPSVKVFSNGDVLAVWQEKATDDGENEVWYNHYTNDNGTGSWGESARIAVDDVPKSQPKIVSNQTDEVYVMFKAQYGATENLMLAGYDEQTTEWSTEQQIANAHNAMDTQPSIAMDDDGNMMLLWFDIAGAVPKPQVRTRYYDSALASWGDIALINIDSAGNFGTGTKLVVDAHNNFTAVWSQKVNGALEDFPFILFNRYLPDQGWGDTAIITGSYLGINPKMAVNNEDNIMLIYQQTAADGLNLLFSSYDAVQQNWTEIELLETNEQPSGLHKISVDGEGNMMAIWNQNRSGTFFTTSGVFSVNPPAIWTRRFGPTSSSGDDEWGQAKAISSIGGTVDTPYIAQNARGEILVTWLQTVEGTLTINSRYFE